MTVTCARATALPTGASLGRVSPLYWWGMVAIEARPAGAADSSWDSADQADVRRSRQGDGDAYARLVQRHQATIARQMWHFTRDPDKQAELVQEVFVNAYLSLASYREEAPFLHWLRKVAVRTGYAHWRRTRRRARERPLEPEVAALLAAEPEDGSAAEAAELVHRVLDRLPPRDRLVLTLLHLEERSVAEVAALVGWSETMVKVQAWRARGKLKKMLAKAYEP